MCLLSQSKKRMLTKNVVARFSAARGIMQRFGRMIGMLTFPLVDVCVWYYYYIGHHFFDYVVGCRVEKFLRRRHRNNSQRELCVGAVPREQSPDSVLDGLTEHLRTWADSGVLSV